MTRHNFVNITLSRYIYGFSEKAWWRKYIWNDWSVTVGVHILISLLPTLNKLHFRVEGSSFSSSGWFIDFSNYKKTRLTQMCGGSKSAISARRPDSHFTLHVQLESRQPTGGHFASYRLCLSGCGDPHSNLHLDKLPCYYN